jgi:TldD protein
MTEEKLILVEKIFSGYVSPINGDFKLMAKGYLMEGGVKKKFSENFSISGNILETIKSIVDIGNDFKIVPNQCHKSGQTIPVLVGSPSIKVIGMCVGGTAYEI